MLLSSFLFCSQDKDSNLYVLPYTWHIHGLYFYIMFDCIAIASAYRLPISPPDYICLFWTTLRRLTLSPIRWERCSVQLEVHLVCRPCFTIRWPSDYYFDKGRIYFWCLQIFFLFFFNPTNLQYSFQARQKEFYVPFHDYDGTCSWQCAWGYH